MGTRRRNGVVSIRAQQVEIAQAYEKGRAACLSVLTDEKYFKGSFENLEVIRNAGVKVHNEREMDRVLGIEGVELIGINNQTFEVDISNTKKLLERGQKIHEKDIIISGPFAGLLAIH
ncbi:hypothetical protein Dsin_008638 [Dipteronia sinensis]|uniref:indole-3-glycerol-phosphate synthase n=1 Tax=Dipteronia sinensis TaxID=43782 RepID=A0AAE0APJ9_9ROSI|nr:hypothetical protein Dsin_008638 [Dipteronia sinensis]